MTTARLEPLGPGDLPCDLCGHDRAVEVPHCRLYTGNADPIHICGRCGLVHVRRRRGPQEIVDTWSQLFARDPKTAAPAYSALNPAIKARQLYCAETIVETIGLKGKSVCDIGSGEGQFLQLLSGSYGAKVFATEASPANCDRLRSVGIDHFPDIIENFPASPSFSLHKATHDVVTMMWALECCHSPRAMMQGASLLVKNGGHIAVGTGSRVLVPFKKTLREYIAPNAVDFQPLRFSVNTLTSFLTVHGFETIHINRYKDSDNLVVIGKKNPALDTSNWKGDNYLEVYDFFDRWHRESIHYY